MQDRNVEKIYLGHLNELNPEKTFECGQCFRWNMDDSGDYFGVAFGKAAILRCCGEKVYIICEQGDYEAVWHDYLDMDRDYEAIRNGFDAGEYLAKCADYGSGIRILRQERWEALCSFIISQCNNIPRIKGIVEKLCENFGEKRSFCGREYYSFPSAERVAMLDVEELAVLRAGYRAAYIINAARAVAYGSLDLDKLTLSDQNEAMKGLLSLSGVGNKVANCVLLFGLGHMEAFPVDVWMKRALKEHFPPDFDPESLGEYAGLAQQYIFYYARSTNNG